MFKESNADVFIRLLTDALEEDRLVKAARLAARSKACTERLKQLYMSDMDKAMESLDSLDRIHRKTTANVQLSRTG